MFLIAVLQKEKKMVIDRSVYVRIMSVFSFISFIYLFITHLNYFVGFVHRTVCAGMILTVPVVSYCK